MKKRGEISKTCATVMWVFALTIMMIVLGFLPRIADWIAKVT